MGTILFNKSYSQVGSTNSDFLIRCRGNVKIQLGNKFIDLIKDGKINIDSKVVKQVRDRDSIGRTDGIYVTESQEIFLKSQDNIIDLSGTGTSYVSFMDVQNTTSEEKYTALQNIGLIYDSLDQITEQSLQNGIIYITSLQKLYTVVDGILSEYSVTLSNNQNGQFIIQKNDSSRGAIVIIGNGINNSLAFNSLYIYTDDSQSYLDSTGTFHFIINDIEVATISQDMSAFNSISSNSIQSADADDNYGFKLYRQNNTATIQTDTLIARQNITSNNNLSLSDNTNSVATTSWTHSQIPTGSIVLFNGKNQIPEGWYLCNGENGTPDLSQQFITTDNDQIVYIYKSI